MTQINADSLTNLLNCQIGRAKQFARSLHPDPDNELVEGFAGVFLEQVAKTGRGEADSHGRSLVRDLADWSGLNKVEDRRNAAHAIFRIWATGIRCFGASHLRVFNGFGGG